jgi:hypothetical protein
LAIFLIFYKLLLEKETIHTFKRFYLLGALIVSFIIPSITFIEYIEPVAIAIETYNPVFEVNETPQNIVIEEQINYLPIILCCIYGLGVLLFGLKFCINLFRITKKIKRNPKYKKSAFTNVLLLDLITPHTFFNYIFLNKNKFETQQIPEEVLLHEEAHAKQKHSLDVLFIELLQVIFWFNPLLYISKKAIKLNHEFLADKAVLKEGIQPSTYQQMLLAFSSNASHPTLANAINYSLIKKRFTIMKSQTSKKAILLRSLILLPLLGGLLFSFSNTKQVEREVDSTSKSQDLTNELIITLKPNGQFLYNDKIVNITEIDKLVTPETNTISILSDGEISNSTFKKATSDISTLGVKGLNYNTTNATKEKHYNNLDDSNYRKIVTPSVVDRVKETFNDVINNNPVLEIKQNPLRLKLNGQATSLETLTKDYETIVGEQRDLKIYVRGEINMTLINTIRTKLKDNVNKIKLSQGAHIIGGNTTPLVSEQKNNTPSTKKTLPKIGATVCYNCNLTVNKAFIEKAEITTNKDETVTEFKIKFIGKPSLFVKGNTLNDKALSYLKDAKGVVTIFGIKSENGSIDSNINLNIKEDKESAIIEKTIPVVNGIKCDNCTLFLSKTGVEKLIISTTTGEPITRFKIKFPGKPTESIKGNTANNNAKVKANLEGATIGTLVQLFDIRTKEETLTPVMIEVVDRNNPKYSKSPIVTKSEISDLPPPPPPPAPIHVKKGRRSLNEIIESTPKDLKSGYKSINGESHYYITYRNGVTTYYNKFGIAVDKNGKALPPPPPPPAPEKGIKKHHAPKKMANAKVKTGYLDIDGKKHYYTTVDGKTKYFNRYGVETDKKGKELTPNKQVHSDQVLPNSNISKVYFNDKVVSEFKTSGNSIHEEVPEIPSMLALKNKGAIFYYGGEKITGKKAIDLVDNNRDLNILIRNIEAKHPIVKLSTEPIRL